MSAKRDFPVIGDAATRMHFRNCIRQSRVASSVAAAQILAESWSRQYLKIRY